jgi:hypothetical protein
MSLSRDKLSWLSEKDEDEWKWAAKYLLRQCPPELEEKLTFSAVPNYSSVVRSIDALESEAKGVKLIARLRNAIRQRRYRSAKGGRATCSFTLPRQTKATLKWLAKSQNTTETAVIERLIEGASKAAQDQKEGKRREALVEKVTRNSSKIAHELNQVRIEEAKKHLKYCLKQLADWEVFYEGVQLSPDPEDEATATELATKRMREIQAAISAAVAQHELMNPRSRVNVS